MKLLPFHVLAAALVAFFSTHSILAAAENPEQPDRESIEKAFSAMLENATLHGTWAPVAEGILGDEKKDGYFILRAFKQEGARWVIVSRINYKGRQIDVPIPVIIQFAGDAAVMILDDVPIGEGQTWSARILFHEDVYAGSWWGADKVKGGIVSGVITREKKEDKEETEKKEPEPEPEKKQE